MNDLSSLARKNQKDISILLPSRRPHLLLDTIENLVDKTNNLHALEIIVRLDHDDVDSLSTIPKLPHSKVDIIVVVGDRYGGYKGTGFFFNEMAAISRGEFLCLFGDDVLMQTQNWDKKVSEHIGQEIILDNGNWQFPMMSRKVYEKLGHICLGAHPDTWINKIVNSLPKIKKEIDIHYTHDRYEETGRHKDELYENKIEAFKETKPQYTQLVKDHLASDVSKLK